jgi:pimeloyl-ACP methyl ester carboxylesterase
MAPYRHAWLQVRGIRTHYLEAGEGPAVVLLHSGEYGGCAELSWRYTIPALAERFRVLAPDMLGYGETAKLHAFDGPSELRINHIAWFCEAQCIERAHFMGSSYGGSLLLRVASAPFPAWPIDRIVVVSGGGQGLNNAARETLESYDGSREAMRQILEVLFYSGRFSADQFVDEWHRSSLRPGAWEAASAARLQRPGQAQEWHGEAHTTDVRRPTLIVAGADDLLYEPGYAERLAAELPDARAVIFPEARHCSHIEHAERFNALALAFLDGKDSDSAPPQSVTSISDG